MPVPLPPAYEALRGGSVARASAGAPVTVTGAEKLTAIATVLLSVYAESPPDESTPVTYDVAGVPTMMRESGPPGPEPGRAVPTASPALSCRPPVPPPVCSAVLAYSRPSPSASPGCTV